MSKVPTVDPKGVEFDPTFTKQQPVVPVFGKPGQMRTTNASGRPYAPQYGRAPKITSQGPED